MLQEVFLRVLRFFPPTEKKKNIYKYQFHQEWEKKNHYVDLLPLIVIYFISFYFIPILLFLLGIALLYHSTLKLMLQQNQIQYDSLADQKQEIEKTTDSWKARCTRTAGASSTTSAVKSRFFHHSCIIRGRTGNDSSKWEERAGENHVASWKREGNWDELTFAKTSGTVTGNGKKMANS